MTLTFTRSAASLLGIGLATLLSAQGTMGTAAAATCPYTVTPSIATQAAWDAQFTSFYGTSVPDLDGNSATFAWHGHYWVRAYVSMAKTYGDPKYLDRAVTSINHWFAYSASNGWSNPGGNSQTFLETGMIAQGIMYFVYAAWSDSRFAAYRTQADQFLARLEPMLRSWDYTWVDSPPLCGAPGSYIYATCGAGSDLCGNASLLLYSQGAAMAKSWLLIDRVKRLKGQTPDPAYLHKADATAAYYLNFAMFVPADNADVWDSGGCRAQGVEDATRGHIDLSLLIWARRFGLGGLTSTNMTRLAGTLQKVLNGSPADDVWQFVNGTGKRPGPNGNWDRVPVGYDWIDLAEYDPTVLDKIIKVFNAHLVNVLGSRFFLGWAEILRWINCVQLTEAADAEGDGGTAGTDGGPAGVDGGAAGSDGGPAGNSDGGARGPVSYGVGADWGGGGAGLKGWGCQCAGAGGGADSVAVSLIVLLARRRRRTLHRARSPQSMGLLCRL